MSTIINLTMLQATDFLAAFQVNDANNNPVNLTTVTIESQMRHQYNSPVAYTFSCNGYSNGYLTIQLPSNTTIMNAASYVYDIYIKDSSLTTVRLIEGTIRVTPAVTTFV